MKRRIAAGVVGTIAVLGLAYVPASPLESGISDSQANWNRETKAKITEDDPRWNCHTMGNKICGKWVSVAQAENEAIQVLKDLEPYCAKLNKAAQAWAEINSSQPKGYEVIGECTATFRAGP